MLKRTLPPNTVPLGQLSQKEDIGGYKLIAWRAEASIKGELLPDAAAGAEGWSSRNKFTTVLETATAKDADLAFLSLEHREKDIYC